MRRTRNLIQYLTNAAIVSAAATSPSVALAQELNPPETRNALQQLQRSPGMQLERSVLASASESDYQPAPMTISDDDMEPVSAEPIVSAELLQQRTADGRIHIERWVTEDASGNLVNNGLYKEYDSKGAIIRTGNFRMGKLDGAWKQTIPLAQAKQIADTIDAGFRAPFHSEANFVQGKLEGDWTLADAAGNAVAVLQFEDHKRTGASIWLNSRGKVVREIHYKQGIPDGPAVRLTSTQKEPEKIVYYQGKVLKSRTVWYDPDRRTKKKIEESFLVASGEQAVSHDWWDSQITTQALSAAGEVRHGMLVGWHSNGAKSVEGQFLNDKPVGQFQWWYPSGQLQSKGVYEDGLMTGTWAWWYPNGMKMLLGDFQQGEQAGLWSQWTAEGKLVQRDAAEKFPAVRQEIIANLETRQAADNTGLTRQPQPTRSPQPVYRSAALPGRTQR
jgi:antitoxin component YwqK of YwqJK toxin-antitoxin module